MNITKKIIEFKKYYLVIVIVLTNSILFAQKDSSSICICERMTNYCDSLDLSDAVTEIVMIRPASKWKAAEYAKIEKRVFKRCCLEQIIVYPCDCAEKAKFDLLKANLYDEITIPAEYRNITVYNAEGYAHVEKILIKPLYKKLVLKYKYPAELKNVKR